MASLSMTRCRFLYCRNTSVDDKILKQFATTEAIQCMGIYKFVQKLGNKEFEMPFLQVVEIFL